MNIAKYIDHTVLAADAKTEKIVQICEEAKEYGFASVCVNSRHVPLCKELLKNSGVNVCTVVGFPLGAMSTQAKAYEANVAVNQGADEVDMVINIGALKDRDSDFVLEDIKRVKESCQGKLLKVIIETCLLTDEEKEIACKLSMEAHADFVKTSTGFSKGGAKAEDVALMRRVVGDRLGVKASGGIRDYDTALAMINAGANRLGCSSGVEIVKGEVSDVSY